MERDRAFSESGDRGGEDIASEAQTRRAHELLRRLGQRRDEETEEIKRVADTFGCPGSEARRLIAETKISGKVQPDGTIIDP